MEDYNDVKQYKPVLEYQYMHNVLCFRFPSCGTCKCAPFRTKASFNNWNNLKSKE